MMVILQLWLFPVSLLMNWEFKNSKVTMSLIKDLDGNKHLLVSRAYMEIVLE